MRIRSIPDLQGFIALRGRVIVDTYRGSIRVRSWPKKQTAAHKAKNANQIRWFAAAREMAKWAIPSEINASKLAAKGKGFYPGDIQMMAAAGNLIPLIHGDPENYEKWQPFLDPVSFQGLRAPMAANQVIVPSATTALVWGVPEFQTTQFWTAGDPTHLVIPAGVTKVRVDAACQWNGANPTFFWLSLQLNDATDQFLGIGVDSTSSRKQVTTGPMQVSEGDTLRALVNINAAGSMWKSSTAWIALEVLETTV